jgi:DNA (cytosine-5)-methyltransferase 1
MLLRGVHHAKTYRSQVNGQDLEGGRSGLFYEGMRIINELRKASNGRYPRISIWENVYGALNSNKGEDFEAILKEMVEAGSLLCEWRVLDAQYFGVPQRRRRVFVVAVFDSATANRCPDPLLPVSEGLLWHPTTRATTREESADTTSASIGSGSQWWNAWVQVATMCRWLRSLIRKV